MTRPVVLAVFWPALLSDIAPQHSTTGRVLSHCSAAMEHGSALSLWPQTAVFSGL